MHYSVSKGGLIVDGATLAREFGSFGINVNAVAPSTAETDLLKDLKLDGQEGRAGQDERDTSPRHAG